MRKYHLWCRQMLFLWIYTLVNKENFCLPVETISRGRCLLGFDEQIHFLCICYTIKFDAVIRNKTSEYHLIPISFCFSGHLFVLENHRLPFLQPWACYPGKSWKVQAVNICNWEKEKDKNVSFVSVIRQPVQCGIWVHFGKDLSFSNWMVLLKNTELIFPSI